MPRAGLALSVFLAAAPAAVAQLPPGPPADRVPVPGTGTPAGLQPGGVPAATPVGASAAPPAQLDPALKAHLEAWQKVMAGSTNFYAECTLTRRHLVLKNKVNTYAGTIICLKPTLARLRIEAKPAPGEQADPNNYVAYICTGRAVFEYDGAQRKVTEHPLPQGGVGDNLMLEFMSGTLTADAIAQRFDLKLLKEDQHYVYLEIRPRTGRDKQEFETMTLVLFRPSVPGMAYLPRTVVMRKANGQEEESWDFPQPRTNVEGITPKHFEPVPPPKDWKYEKAGAATPPAPPRVARPGTP